MLCYSNGTDKDVRTSLKQNTRIDWIVSASLIIYSRRVEKHANDAETVSGVLFQFYFTMCDGLNSRCFTIAHFTVHFAGYSIIQTPKSTELISTRFVAKESRICYKVMMRSKRSLMRCNRSRVAARKPRDAACLPAFRPKFLGCSLWSRSKMLGSADSEHHRLTNREIIFEVKF